MSRTGNLKKYLLIIRLLQDYKSNAPSLKAIQAHLEDHGFENTSSRTLSRDFQALNAEFGINIQHNPRKRGYQICNATDEDLSDFHQFIKLLEMAERVETISQTLQTTRTISKNIVFEHNDFFIGSEHLKPLADAIQQKLMIRFSYHSYLKKQAEHYTIAPHLIMEHRNRWYVLGRDQKQNKVKTFGLDRIQNIEYLDTYPEANEINYKTLFKHTFGITCLEESPSKVVLSFTAQQGKYIKSLPLHHSQQILVDTREELRILLKVVLNIDLKMQILSYGSSVEVLEPLALREEIADEIKKSLKKYLVRQDLA